MKVLMFRTRFHAPLLSGQKRQTIRRQGGRVIRPGEELSLRAWLDKPYRSKQHELLQVRCLAVVPIEITAPRPGKLEVKLGTDTLGPMEAECFARDDGFEDMADMAAFWGETHKLAPPDDSGLFHDGIDLFRGMVIQWGEKSG